MADHRYELDDDSFCVAMSPKGKRFPLDLEVHLSNGDEVTLHFTGEISAMKVLHMLSFQLDP